MEAPRRYGLRLARPLRGLTEAAGERAPRGGVPVIALRERKGQGSAVARRPALVEGHPPVPQGRRIPIFVVATPVVIGTSLLLESFWLAHERRAAVEFASGSTI